jgi:hypothetical protein
MFKSRTDPFVVHIANISIHLNSHHRYFKDQNEQHLLKTQQGQLNRKVILSTKDTLLMLNGGGSGAITLILIHHC